MLTFTEIVQHEADLLVQELQKKCQRCKAPINRQCIPSEMARSKGDGITTPTFRYLLYENGANNQ